MNTYYRDFRVFIYLTNKIAVHSPRAKDGGDSSINKNKTK